MNFRKSSLCFIEIQEKARHRSKSNVHLLMLVETELIASVNADLLPVDFTQPSVKIFFTFSNEYLHAPRLRQVRNKLAT